MKSPSLIRAEELAEAVCQDLNARPSHDGIHWGLPSVRAAVMAVAEARAVLKSMDEPTKKAAPLLTEFAVMSMGLLRRQCNEVLAAWGLPTIPLAQKVDVVDAQAALEAALAQRGGDWQPIESIPTGRPVWVRSVSGIECLARTSHDRDERYFKGPDRWGPKRVPCFRLDGRSTGDVSAVAWREPPTTEESGT